MEKQTIGISLLITLLVVSVGFNANEFFETPKYYCESRPEVEPIECDGFSKYVAENGKCLNPDGNKICREGWKLIENDLIIVPTSKITLDDLYKEIKDSVDKQLQKCVNVSTIETFPVPVIKETCYENNNSCSEEIVKFKQEEREKIVKMCKKEFDFKNKTYDYGLQGYNCKDNGVDIICDSYDFGDGNGVCHPNGGESCCKIDQEGNLMCKDGSVDWIETRIPTKRLEAKS